MENLIEEYCRRCGDTFDPRLGCRCSLVIGVEVFDGTGYTQWLTRSSGFAAGKVVGQIEMHPGFWPRPEECSLRLTT